MTPESLIGRVSGSRERGAIQATVDSRNRFTSDDGSLEVVLLGRPYTESTDAVESGRPALTARHVASLWRDHREALTGRLRGRFCIGIIDHRRQQALIVVDRFASIPVCLATDRHGTYHFGTSIESVARNSDRCEIDPNGLYAYVYSHVVPGPSSVYRGVRKVPPASFALIRSGDLTLREYWKPEFSQRTGSIAERSEALLDAIQVAVARDDERGRTGCFLSGGLDSSTVAGMHARLSDEPTPAFTIGFDAPGYDEMQYSEAVAKHFGLSLRDYYLTPPDIVEAMPAVAAACGEPFGNSSAVAVLACARLARDAGLDVMLAGDGGDELFGGNERYRFQRYFRPYELTPRLLRRWLIDPIAERLPTGTGPPLLRKVGRYFEQARVPLPDRLEDYNFLHRNSPHEVFERDFLTQVDIAKPLEEKRQRFNACDAPTALHRMLYLDWKYTLADNDLRKVNDMCALAGVEARYPLLADEIVDLACELPANWLIKRNELRFFFRRSVSGLLPQSTLEKSKHGFGLPFGLWLGRHKPLSELVNDSLMSLKRRKLFRQDFLARLQQDHRDEHAAYYGELIWILTMLELWLANRSRCLGSDGQ